MAKKPRKHKKGRGFGSNSEYSRVRKILWRHHKKQFPEAKYREFIANETDADGNKVKGTSIVSRVYAKCKDRKCDKGKLVAFYDDVFSGSDKPVILYPDTPLDYYEVFQAALYSNFSNDLYILCPHISQRPAVIRPSEYVLSPDFGYDQHFREYVNWGNSYVEELIVSLGLEKVESGKDYMPKFCFGSKGPDGKWEIGRVYWSKKNNRWETYLYPCDNDGQLETFGFEPTQVNEILGDEGREPSIPDGGKKKDVEVPESIEAPKEIESAQSRDLDRTSIRKALDGLETDMDKEMSRLDKFIMLDDADLINESKLSIKQIQQSKRELMAKLSQI